VTGIKRNRSGSEDVEGVSLGAPSVARGARVAAREVAEDASRNPSKVRQGRRNVALLARGRRAVLQGMV
jgi:hypothetical protein